MEYYGENEVETSKDIKGVDSVRFVLTKLLFICKTTHPFRFLVSHAPLTFAKFDYCRRSMASGKSPGPSGLTSTQVKHWGPDTAKYIYDLSSLMWEHHHVPEWWQDRHMILLRKTHATHDLANIRPIPLFQVIWKLWADMVAKRVQRAWHKHNLLHPNQHGFRPQRGTHIAILHVFNRLEGAHLDEPLFITFWDIPRAFDSIPKWIQTLSWARLSIEGKDLEWFLKLDAVRHITIRTPYQQKHVKASNGHQVLAGDRMLQDHATSFHLDRGIGQGDIPSTLISIAVFDILLLTLLEDSGTRDAHAYVDDLAHLAQSLAAQQRQACANLRHIWSRQYARPRTTSVFEVLSAFGVVYSV